MAEATDHPTLLLSERPAMKVLLLIFMMIISISHLAHGQSLSLCTGRFACTSQGDATVGMDSNVRLMWRGEAIDLAREGSILMSPQGRFMLDNPFGEQTLGRISATLTKRLSPNDGNELRISERLSVPASVSQQAARAGARQIYYVRDFQLNQGQSITAVQSINLRQSLPGRRPTRQTEGTAAAGRVDIQSLTLTFQNGTLNEVIRPNTPLQARARLRFRQAGRLNAVWELATPASTGGQAIYVPLKMVNRYLSGSEITLLSPALPSTMNGLHRLRLRVLSPHQADIDPADLPTLSYRVSDTALAMQETVPTLTAWRTENTAPLTRHHHFRWQPVPGSHAYQLEVYTDLPPSQRRPRQGPQPVDLGQAPNAGQLIRGQYQTISPSASLLNHLTSDRRYFWRLVAIGRDGDVLAASPLEAIHP